MPQFESWSFTRYDDYSRCPAFAKYRHLDKLCPNCFKGKIKGGFGTPAVCSTCKHVVVKGDALERGIEVGGNLEKYINGEVPRIHKEIKNKGVKALAKSFRDSKKKGLDVRTERSFNFARGWSVHGESWSPALWLISKLDVFAVSEGRGRVVDWKTGGVDKRTKEIKPGNGEKYEKQLKLYNVAVLSALPELTSVSSSLEFVDVKDGAMHTVTGPLLTRAELPKARKEWEKDIIPMFSDKTFAPTANFGCGWCEFSKAKGGPCRF